MTRYLTDTNVLCEPTRTAPSPKVIAWLERNLARLVVDPIVLGEIRAGILALPKGSRRKSLEVWLDRLVSAVECVPWDTDCGLRWAQLVADMRRAGTAMPVPDSMIAATALVHGFTLATRNVRDFERAGVKVVNPFD